MLFKLLEEDNMEHIDELSKIEEALLQAIKAAANGTYEKTNEGYMFELGENNKFIAVIDDEILDFQIPTLKWVPGNYEPIDGIELYLRIPRKELEGLEKKELFDRLLSTINNLDK